MIDERAKYTANTGTTLISTANSNLNGTGTLGTVITAASNGTLITRVFIKATTTVTRGMVRLFIYDGTNTCLLKEVSVNPVTIVTTTGIDQSFEAILDMNFNLKSGECLKASTEIANSFSVTAEGLDWTY